MKDVVKKPDPVRVACEVCLKEIPESQARHAEAGDYVMQFCGLECYRLWRERGENEYWRSFTGEGVRLH